MRESTFDKFNKFFVPVLILLGLAGFGFIIADVVFGYNYFEQKNKTERIAEIQKEIEAAKFFKEPYVTVDISGGNYQLDINKNKKLTFSSSDPAIAEVNEFGVLIPKQSGQVIITATDENGESKDCEVSILSFSTQSIDLKDEKVSLTPNGSTYKIEYDILPKEKRGEVVTFSSENNEVATVDEKGVVTPKGIGSTKIVLTAASNGVTSFLQVEVKESVKKIEKIKLNQTKLFLNIDETKQLSVEIIPNDAVYEEVKWSSENEKIATVDQNGNVVGVSAGKTKINVVTSNGIKQSCEIVVEKKKSTSIKNNDIINITKLSFSDSEIYMNLGSSRKVSVNIEPSNATNKTINWESSDTNVVAVDSSGNLNALGVGRTTIRAISQNGITTEMVVNVTEVLPESIKVDNKTITLSIGGKQKINYSVLPDNCTNKNVRFTSNNTNIATVDENGNVYGKSIGETTISIFTMSGDKREDVRVIVQDIVPSSVTIDRSVVTLNANSGINLYATVNPSNATNKGVTWSSSNTSVATVNQNGYVNALSYGTATITVTTSNGKTATCKVSVVKVNEYVSSVTLNKTSVSIESGKTYTLSATVNPSNATNKSVTWSSSNTSVATVNSNGVVTAVNPGSATITVKTNDGGRTAKCSVTVTAVPVSSITLNKTSASVSVGSGISLSATVNPTNATNKSVTWSSSNTSVATVSSSGYVTTKTPGFVTITAKSSNGKSASCSVTVNPVLPTSVSVNKSYLTLENGKTATLTATVNPSNATNKSVTWSSSNTSVATVSSSGVVTAKSKGTATITVKTKEGKGTATVSVTVNDVSQSKKFTATFYANYSGGNSQTVSCTTTGSSCTVSAPSLYRNGYEFVGWGESSGTTSSKYSASSTITLSSNKSFYGVTKKTLRATFNANGSNSISFTSNTCNLYNNDTSCWVTTPTITRSGGTAIGWSTSSSAKSVSSYNIDRNVQISSNVTYYAISSKTVTAYFDKNGATSISFTSRSCTMYNTQSYCSVNTPVVHWHGRRVSYFTNSPYSDSYYAGYLDTINISSDITLYNYAYPTNTGSKYAAYAISINSYSTNGNVMIEHSSSCPSSGVMGYANTNAIINNLLYEMPFLKNVRMKITLLSRSEFLRAYNKSGTLAVTAAGHLSYAQILVPCSTDYIDEYYFRQTLVHEVGHAFDRWYNVSTGSAISNQYDIQYWLISMNTNFLYSSNWVYYANSTTEFWAQNFSTYYWYAINGWARTTSQLRQALNRDSASGYSFRLKNSSSDKFGVTDLYNSSSRLYYSLRPSGSSYTYGQGMECALRKYSNIANSGYNLNADRSTCY